MMAAAISTSKAVVDPSISSAVPSAGLNRCATVTATRTVAVISHMTRRSITVLRNRGGSARIADSLAALLLPPRASSLARARDVDDKAVSALAKSPASTTSKAATTSRMTSFDVTVSAHRLADSVPLPMRSRNCLTGPDTSPIGEKAVLQGEHLLLLVRLSMVVTE